MSDPNHDSILGNAPENLTSDPRSGAHGGAVLELTVNNHPGVMSHVCGLFARRTYNVEGVACLPVNGGETSRVWLLVREDERLPQVVRQVEKLHDVLAVTRHDDGHPVFAALSSFVA
ncbi:hypothetical protein dsx2_3030 [Desulfovibrio sp. X2]|uniref:acetolactate synthase small subunit n=1 Tax=Desulfovibrio sp. X2 TaxID=941449 RepID=UPI000358720F|nr:acetolactate synthase small subunit [Desulfovibrio sp. X2]EPR41680.1 hypothetical protein dsx2_3030 [Desulfovibrio sp. X2]